MEAGLTSCGRDILPRSSCYDTQAPSIRVDTFDKKPSSFKLSVTVSKMICHEYERSVSRPLGHCCAEGCCLVEGYCHV